MIIRSLVGKMDLIKIEKKFIKNQLESIMLKWVLLFF